MSEKMLRLTIPEGAERVYIEFEHAWCGGSSQVGAIENYKVSDLETAPRPRKEIIEYIRAVTHLPCSCQACQLKRSILFWAFPGIKEEADK